MRATLGTIVALSLTISTANLARAGQETEAQAAVHEAESAVQNAREHKALWTTAEEALKRAREALSRRDYAAARAAAERATQQARLGLKQTGYADFQWLIKESP
jgi:4'-phosphopantetheinyl transferase EntD